MRGTQLVDTCPQFGGLTYRERIYLAYRDWLDQGNLTYREYGGMLNWARDHKDLLGAYFGNDMVNEVLRGAL